MPIIRGRENIIFGYRVHNYTLFAVANIGPPHTSGVCHLSMALIYDVFVFVYFLRNHVTSLK